MKKENLFLTFIANKFKNNSICKIYATIDNNEAFKNKEVFINENEIFSLKEIIIRKGHTIFIMTDCFGNEFKYKIFFYNNIEYIIKHLMPTYNGDMREVYDALFYVNNNKIDLNINSILVTPAIISSIRTEIVFNDDDKTVDKTKELHMSIRARKATKKAKKQQEQEMIEQLENELYKEK